MKIFVTGSTGFIGKHLVNRILADGHEVTINLYQNEKSPFSDIVKTFQLSENNIENDIDFLKHEKFDGVIHLASLYLTVHKPENVVSLIDSNIRFSAYILECASTAGVSWFINTGTFWQNFGNGEYSPVNLYAATKQAFQSIAQYYIETDKIRFATLKLCDTFGINDTRPKIFNLWKNIAKTGEALDMSPGEQTIDISYIDDIVNAFLLLADHLQNQNPEITNGSVFAVKAEKRYTLKELSTIFEEVTSQHLNINWGKKPYREREVMVPWENGTVVPGWKPQISIREGIRKWNLE